MYVRVVVVEVESGLIMLGEKELQVMITCVCSWIASGRDDITPLFSYHSVDHRIDLTEDTGLI